MKDFHRKLLGARLEGYASEMRFWADYAEDRGYRGAERLRVMAGPSGPSGCAPSAPSGHLPRKHGGGKEGGGGREGGLAFPPPLAGEVAAKPSEGARHA